MREDGANGDDTSRSRGTVSLVIVGECPMATRGGEKGRTGKARTGTQQKLEGVGSACALQSCHPTLPLKSRLDSSLTGSTSFQRMWLVAEKIRKKKRDNLRVNRKNSAGTPRWHLLTKNRRRGSAEDSKKRTHCPRSEGPTPIALPSFLSKPQPLGHPACDELTGLPSLLVVTYSCVITVVGLITRILRQLQNLRSAW